MAQEPREKIIRQVCEYLSPYLKKAIFNLLYSTYQNEEYLAQEIGCSIESLHRWKKDLGEIPDDKYMLIILSMTLTKCPEVKDLLKEGLLKTVQHLCNELGICQDNQGEGRCLKENISLFLNALDEKSRKIFWYLRCHGYARLSELAELIRASTDMEVLYFLREIINPIAVRIFGRPVLEFFESRIDRITGKKVLFNWWIMDFIQDNQPLIGKGEKPLVDLFNEDDQIVIISEISPSVRVRDRVKVEQRHGILSIWLDKLQ